MNKFTSEFRIEWAHCDAAGIVFYPHYYTWFDQGTERLFTEHRLSYPELAEQFGISGMPLLETGASYKSACRLGSLVRVTSRLDEISGRTFVMRHRIEHADGALAADGFERRVMVREDQDSRSGIRAVEFPEEIGRRILG